MQRKNLRSTIAARGASNPCQGSAQKRLQRSSPNIRPPHKGAGKGAVGAFISRPPNPGQGLRARSAIAGGAVSLNSNARPAVSVTIELADKSRGPTLRVEPLASIQGDSLALFP